MNTEWLNYAREMFDIFQFDILELNGLPWDLICVDAVDEVDIVVDWIVKVDRFVLEVNNHVVPWPNTINKQDLGPRKKKTFGYESGPLKVI